MHDLAIRGAVVPDGLGHDPIGADVIRDGGMSASGVYSNLDKGPGHVLGRFLAAASLASAAQ